MQIDEDDEERAFAKLWPDVSSVFREEASKAETGWFVVQYGDEVMGPFQTARDAREAFSDDLSRPA